jgi:hypothetical protein
MGRSPSAGGTTRRPSRCTTTALACLAALTTLLLFSPTAWANTAVPDSGYVTNGEVKAIAHAGSVTYIGGTFTEVGPATGPGVGINESTGADLGWARIWGSGGSISAVVSDGSGGYYIGGSFSEVAGHAAENLAHIKSNGEVDTGWLPKAVGEVKALAVSGGIVYVGGAFTVIGTNSQARNRIAALKASGVAGEGEATSWNPKASNTVNALAVSGTSVVYVGGIFTEIGSTAVIRNRLAAIKTNAEATATAEATSWNPKASNTVNALALSGTSVVYVGGTFTEIGSTVVIRNRLAAIKTNAEATETAEATSWNPNANNTVSALALSGTSVVYVGGAFTEIGSTVVIRNRLAAIKTNAEATETAEATSWNPKANNTVNALALSGTSVVYVGGTFTEIGSTVVVRHRIAAIKTNAEATATAEATSWNPNAINGEVKALAVSGSVVYAGGTFQSVGLNSKVRNRLAAFNSDNEPTSWNPNANNTVNALALSGSSVVYAGGTFTKIGSIQVARNRLAAIKTNAEATAAAEATSWNPNASNTVNALALSGTSVVYVGGTFETIGSTAVVRNRLAAIKTNAEATATAEATSWNPNATSGEVKALAVSGEVVYVGGTFETIGTNAAVRNRIAAIKTNAEATATAEATSWNPNASTAASAVNALAVSGSSVVYVGGSFTTIGSTQVTRNRLAAIKTNAEATATAEATTWNPNANNTVNALTLSGSSVVYVGGSFTKIGSIQVTRDRIAAIETNAEATATAEATSWNPNANNTVNALTISASGSRLYIGGIFTSLGTGDRAYYASFTFGGPTALFSVSAGPYTAGVTTVTFTNESTDATSSITSYEWTFGDGGTSTSASPTHEYSAPCSPCTITVKVTDAEGLSAEVSHIITVAEGTLTFFTTSPTLPVLPSVVLNGEPQTTFATMNNFTVDDARSGAGAGWNVTVASQATVGSTVSETFKEYCNSASPCGPNAAERYVSGGRELPANSLTLKKTAASFTALPGGTGSAPALECATECHVDHSTAEKVATAAAGAGKGGWQTTGFSALSLSLATPMNLYVLPNANEVYRVDIVWTLNSGP